MPQVVVEMTSQEAAAWAGIQRLARGTDEFEKSLKKTSTAAKEAAVEQKKLEQAAMRVFEETRTPMERHGQQMAKLNDLFKRGLIDVETFGRATKQSAQSLESGFGSGAISKLTAFAGAIGATTSAVALLSTAWNQAADAKRKAGEDLAGSARGEAEHLQNVNSPEEWKRIREIERDIYAKGATADRASAHRLAYQLAAVGQIEDRDTYTRAAASGLLLDDPSKMVEATETIRKSMGAGAGNIQQIMSQGFAAGSKSKLRPDVLLEASAKSGQSARGLGISSDEVFAATAVLANASSAGEGSTQLNRLLISLRKIGSGKTGGSAESGEQEDLGAAGFSAFDFKGKNLRQMLHDVQSRNLSYADLTKLFGRETGVRGFETLLMNEESYSAWQGDIKQAKDKNLVGQKLGWAEADPRVAAVIEARAAKASDELSAETKYGTTQELLKAVKARHRQNERDRGAWMPDFQAGLDEAAMGFSDIGLSDESKLTNWLNQGVLDKHPSLRRQVIRAIGENPGSWHTMDAKYQTELANMQQAAAGNLNAAAQNLNRPVPTLLRPDDDR